MNLLKDPMVKEYILSFNGRSPGYELPNKCQCLQNNMPEGAHAETTEPFNDNSAELATMRENIRMKSLVMYITKKSYFNGDTMKMLITKMLKCKDVSKVEMVYHVLNTNFLIHPPCAQYMNVEYETFLLTPYRDYFSGMTLWDYLIDCLSRLSSRSFPNQDNKVVVYAIKKLLVFCVDLLQMDFEISQKKNCNPLVMKCLKYNPEKKTRVHKFTKLLDELFTNRKDFKIPTIDLAILVNKFN